jgi:hypothetical protein
MVSLLFLHRKVASRTAEKGLTTLPVLRYGSGHKKHRLKILSILSRAESGALTGCR